MPAEKQAAQEIATTLRDHGHLVYFAGGCVRDALLGTAPKDYDLATSATPEQVQALFPNTDAIGAHFGVILVKKKAQRTKTCSASPTVSIEVATFRTDGSYADNRRPDSVTYSTPEHDAQRRDFTINGLFQDPFTDEIIDHVGGLKDLENKTLRAIGDPQQRFTEDALRLLRAIRFATKTGFDIHPGTLRALHDNAPLLQKIAPERIAQEFSKIVTTPDPTQRARALDLLLETTLADQFLPELRPLIGCEQPPQWHPEGDVYNHTKIALSLLNHDQLPTRDPHEGHDQPPTSAENFHTLCLAVLLHDIAKPPTQTWDDVQKRHRFNGHDIMGADMATKILKRLKYSNQLIADVSVMIENHMRFMNVQDMRLSKLKRFMARPTFPLEIELHRVDCDSSNGFRDNYDFLLAKKEELATELNAPLIPPPLLTGKDLIDHGLQPGPKFKEILTDLQTQQLENHLTTREEALAYLKALLSKEHPPY